MFPPCQSRPALSPTTSASATAPSARAEGAKPSWTAKLLSNPELLCKKVREEAGELCQTLEASEGKERAASEMADLLYHSMVLLNLQVRPRRCLERGRTVRKSLQGHCTFRIAVLLAAFVWAAAMRELWLEVQARGRWWMLHRRSRPRHQHARNSHSCCQGVGMEDVMRVLRRRFGTSGIEEKASRPPKQ